MPPVNALTLITNDLSIAGSNIGTPAEISRMLDLAVEKGVKPWVQTRPLTEANQAVIDLAEGKPRFRYVLVNEKHL
jgi:alcohol dehydrogenase (NADP+)